MTLEFIINNQSVTRGDTISAVAGTNNYPFAHFTIEEGWDADGIQIRAVFTARGGEAYQVYLDSSNLCRVAPEVLSEGFFTVGLIGDYTETDGTEVCCKTELCRVNVSAGATDSAENADFTPSISQQISAALSECETAASRVPYIDLDGYWNYYDPDISQWVKDVKAQGEIGATGAKGDTGATGATGAQGEPGADGTDGFSPTVAYRKVSDRCHRVTITDVNETKSFDVFDGTDGDKGDKGDKGEPGDGVAPIIGAAVPTTSTVGELGQLYMYNVSAWICTAITDGSYYWERIDTYPVKTSYLAPTSSDAGDVGQLWVRQSVYADVYVCVFAEGGSYIWLKLTSNNDRFSATNVTVSTWEADTDYTYSDYCYKADIPITGVTESMLPEVVFDVTEAVSGNYAPVAVCYNGGVRIFAKENTAITIPSIVCEVVA